MAYSDFTVDRALKAFGLTIRQAKLFANVTPVEVTPWLRETLDRGREVPLLSEKVRSELIVMPVLMAARELCGNRFTIFSGQRLDVAPAEGLSGECDFILGLGPPVPVVLSPVAVVLEAKKGDLEAALGQCVAQLVGARAFNEREGQKLFPLFGSVTTGEQWWFMKLEVSALTFDLDRYYIDNLGRILAIFQAIFAHYPAEAAA